MTEKISHLLAKAKDLIVNQKIVDAEVICEEVIRLDPNNINGLLLATKCWMDLNVKTCQIKTSLEKILSLKPNNATAIQGLRKFYEFNMNLYLDDAAKFFHNLFIQNNLTDKDYELITRHLVKYPVSKETEKLIIGCLLTRIDSEKDVNCLKVLFEIGARHFIVENDRSCLNSFLELIQKFDSNSLSSDADELDYLKLMERLFRAYIDQMEPEFFFNLLNNNVYGYMLFAEMLSEHYLFSDCQDTIDRAFDELERSNLLFRESFVCAMKILQIKNLIHWYKVDELKTLWVEDVINFLPKYIWYQAYAIGLDCFSVSDSSWLKIKDEVEHDIEPCKSEICLALMEELPQSTINRIHEELGRSELSSFEWYLWSNIMKKRGFTDKQYEALDRGIKHSRVYFKNYESLADLYLLKNDYTSAVNHLWSALDRYCCPQILETLVDVQMVNEKYDEPIKILEKMEIEYCSESLLKKFILCLNHIDRITDAISIAQRLVKQFSDNGDNWQLLGDLYLKRGNLNSAHTTYSRSLALSGSSSAIFSRLGNVFSLQYQQSFDENDYYKSIEHFNKSLDSGPIIETIEGKSCLHYLHAERLIRQMLFSRAVSEVEMIINLLIDYTNLFVENDIKMNMLGKTVFLAIAGSIDNLIDFTRLSTFINFGLQTKLDPYELGFKCFQLSVDKFPKSAESHFNYGLLALHKLNSECSRFHRDSVHYSDLYNLAESHFKMTLQINSNYQEAWKYLGYLLFRHGISTPRMVFDIQHCLCTALNLTSTPDRLKDPESAFLLSALYVRENWCDLANEISEKLQMDFPIHPIGYISRYLLGTKDHMVAEQSLIGKAILCYNYRDEEFNLNDINFRINDSIVGLFCENLGFLIDSKCDLESFDSVESSPVLILALKVALNDAWLKYDALKMVGARLSPEKHKQYDEYGTFLANLELLTGNDQWGKKLIRRIKFDPGDMLGEKLLLLSKLDESWKSNDSQGSIDNIKALMKCIGLSVFEKNGDSSYYSDIIDNSNYDFTKMVDGLLLSSVISYLSSSTDELLINLNLLISKLSLISTNDSIPLTTRMTIVTTMGALVVKTNNRSLAITFLDALKTFPPDIENKDENLSRIICRLKTLETSAKDGFVYLYNQCLKQPDDTNRWLTMFEFGLEFLEDLRGFIDIEKIFFLVNRPWCLSTYDMERYSKILQAHSKILTVSSVLCHNNMIQRSMRLFPNLYPTNIISKFRQLP